MTGRHRTGPNRHEDRHHHSRVQAPEGSFARGHREKNRSAALLSVARRKRPHCAIARHAFQDRPGPRSAHRAVLRRRPTGPPAQYAKALRRRVEVPHTDPPLLYQSECARPPAAARDGEEVRGDGDPINARSFTVESGSFYPEFPSLNPAAAARGRYRTRTAPAAPQASRSQAASASERAFVMNRRAAQAAWRTTDLRRIRRGGPYCRYSVRSEKPCSRPRSKNRLPD